MLQLRREFWVKKSMCIYIQPICVRGKRPLALPVKCQNQQRPLALHGTYERGGSVELHYHFLYSIDQKVLHYHTI